MIAIRTKNEPSGGAGDESAPKHGSATAAEAPRSLRQRLRSDGAWVVAGRVAAVAAAAAINVLLARLLSPADFGHFVLISSITTFASAWALFGLNRGMVRFVAESLAVGNRARASRALKTGVCLGLVSVITVALLTPAVLGTFVAPLLGLPGSAGLMLLIAALVALLPLHRFIAETLRGFHELRFASLFGGQNGGPLAQALFLVLLCAVGVAFPLSLERALSLLVLALALMLPVAVVRLWRTASCGLAAAVPKPHGLQPVGFGKQPVGFGKQPVGFGKQPVGFGLQLPVTYKYLAVTCLPIMLTQVLLIITNQGDVWIAGASCRPEELALYSAARRTMILVAMPLQLVNLTVLSSIPALHAQGRPRDLQRLLRTAATLAGVPSLAVLLLFIVLPRPILQLLYGEFYGAAALPVAILALGQIVNTWTGTCGLTLIMTGHERVTLMVNLVSAGLLFLAGPLCARQFGIAGLAVISASIVAARYVVLWILVRRYLGVWTHARLRFWSAW